MISVAGVDLEAGSCAVFDAETDNVIVRKLPQFPLEPTPEDAEGAFAQLRRQFSDLETVVFVLSERIPHKVRKRLIFCADNVPLRVGVVSQLQACLLQAASKNPGVLRDGAKVIVFPNDSEFHRAQVERGVLSLTAPEPLRGRRIDMAGVANVVDASVDVVLFDEDITGLSRLLGALAGRPQLLPFDREQLAVGALEKGKRLHGVPGAAVALADQCDRPIQVSLDGTPLFHIAPFDKLPLKREKVVQSGAKVPIFEVSEAGRHMLDRDLIADATLTITTSMDVHGVMENEVTHRSNLPATTSAPAPAPANVYSVPAAPRRLNPSTAAPSAPSRPPMITMRHPMDDNEYERLVRGYCLRERVQHEANVITLTLLEHATHSRLYMVNDEGEVCIPLRLNAHIDVFAETLRAEVNNWLREIGGVQIENYVVNSQPAGTNLTAIRNELTLLMNETRENDLPNHSIDHVLLLGYFYQTAAVAEFVRFQLPTAKVVVIIDAQRIMN